MLYLNSVVHQQVVRTSDGVYWTAVAKQAPGRGRNPRSNASSFSQHGASVSKPHHPFFNPIKPPLSDGGFTRNEVRLANRNPGTLLEGLRYDLTPAGMHYLLIHFDVPFVTSADDWFLSIGGLVDKPLKLTLDQLKLRPQRTITVTMECSGNGRAEVSPRY